MAYYPANLEKAVKRECFRRRYSDKTAETYLFWIRKFLEFCRKDIRYVSKKDVKEFLYNLSENEKAGSTMNVCHMALRFLFEDVLEKRMWIDIHYSKVPERIQRALTKEELKGLFEAIANPKHRLMAELIYSAGLRVSELVNLKVNELNVDKGYGFVRNGKGGKDRIIVIADAIKEKINKLIEEEKLGNGDYLFKSNRKDKYSIRS